MVLCLSNRLCCIWLLINMISSRTLMTGIGFPPRNGTMLSSLPLLLQSLCSLVVFHKITVKNFYSPLILFLGTRVQTTQGGHRHCGTKQALVTETAFHDPSTVCVKCCKLRTVHARSLRNQNSRQYISFLLLYFPLKGNEIHVFSVILHIDG